MSRVKLSKSEVAAAAFKRRAYRWTVCLSLFLITTINIYGMAGFGSIMGGWLSSRLLAQGWSLQASRKTAKFTCWLLVIPVFAAAGVSNYLVATIWIGMASAGHQGFTANLFTMASDTMPGQVVGALVGLGGFVASGLNMFVSAGVGQFLHATHDDYIVLFAIASSVYLLAPLVSHFINPRWEPVRLVGIVDVPAIA